MFERENVASFPDERKISLYTISHQFGFCFGHAKRVLCHTTVIHLYHIYESNMHIALYQKKIQVFTGKLSQCFPFFIPRV